MKDNVGSLFPNIGELDMYRNNFVEASNMLGRQGKFYPVVKEEVINTDVYYNLGTPTDITYMLVERPKVSLLNKFGWNPERRDNLPILCYLSFLDMHGKPINPTEGCVIEIGVRAQAHGDLAYNVRKFKVVDAITDFEMNMFLCNLAPYREQTKPARVIPSPQDPTLEDMYFVRETIYSEDNKNENSGN